MRIVVDSAAHPCLCDDLEAFRACNTESVHGDDQIGYPFGGQRTRCRMPLVTPSGGRPRSRHSPHTGSAPARRSAGSERSSRRHSDRRGNASLALTRRAGGFLRTSPVACRRCPHRCNEEDDPRSTRSVVTQRLDRTSPCARGPRGSATLRPPPRVAPARSRRLADRRSRRVCERRLEPCGHAPRGAQVPRRSPLVAGGRAVGGYGPARGVSWFECRNWRPRSVSANAPRLVSRGGSRKCRIGQDPQLLGIPGLVPVEEPDRLGSLCPESRGADDAEKWLHGSEVRILRHVGDGQSVPRARPDGSSRMRVPVPKECHVAACRIPYAVEGRAMSLAADRDVERSAS
jgi:hypothetical protein